MLLGYGLDDRGSIPGEANDGIYFLFATASRPALGPTQPPIQQVKESLSPGVNRPEREADHLPPFSAEIKNAWNYTFTPQYIFISWCLTKKQVRFRDVVIS
jgi:hypothetical protein